MSVLQTVQKNNRQFTYGQTVQKNNKQFTYGQTVQKNNKQFTYGQTVQKKKKKHLHMDRQCKKLHWSIYSAPDSAKKQQQQFTYGQTVQKKKKKIYIWTDSAKKQQQVQVVQNAAARVLTRSRKYDHITPILQSLHWLPIKFRISYKILLLAYNALNDLAPAYLTNLLSRYNPTRSLRSQNSGLLVVPRIAKSTKGGRNFSYLAPKLWNSLPDNVRGSDTLSLFKSRLKTHLFSQAFI